jgi:DNA-directed RNA polymerase I subunit RPA2
MSFKTLQLQEQAINPSSSDPHYPKLAALSAPHVESFNSIFDLSPGLLEKGIQDIGKITVFDGTQESTAPNKLECKLFNFYK